MADCKHQHTVTKLKHHMFSRSDPHKDLLLGQPYVLESPYHHLTTATQLLQHRTTPSSCLTMPQRCTDEPVLCKHSKHFAPLPSVPQVAQPSSLAKIKPTQAMQAPLPVTQQMCPPRVSQHAATYNFNCMSYTQARTHKSPSPIPRPCSLCMCTICLILIRKQQSQRPTAG